MKEKETKWNEFINANKTAYFESINNDEKKCRLLMVGVCRNSTYI